MPQMKMYDALPPYFGGKRRLNPTIFKHIPPASEAPRLVDAFLGGGSVSLYAKAQGYQVFNNDMGLRSVIVGRALIENNRVKLNDDDLKRLFIPTENDGFVLQHFAPEMFLPGHAEFIDNALAYIDGMEEGAKKYVMKMMMIKFIFHIRPFNQFHSQGAFNIPLHEKRIEYIKQRTYVQSLKDVLEPIFPRLRKLANQINAAIFDNGLENRTSHGDVMDFLPDVQADIAYFDPPYANTLSYDEYHILEQILIRQHIEKEKSGFSSEQAIEFIGEMLRRSEHIPYWVLSFGNAAGSNDIGDLVRIMQQYRDVEPFKIKYKHKASTASDQHKEKSEEFLLIGRPRTVIAGGLE